MGMHPGSLASHPAADHAGKIEKPSQGNYSALSIMCGVLILVSQYTLLPGTGKIDITPQGSYQEPQLWVARQPSCVRRVYIPATQVRLDRQVTSR